MPSEHEIGAFGRPKTTQLQALLEGLLTDLPVHLFASLTQPTCFQFLYSPKGHHS